MAQIHHALKIPQLRLPLEPFVKLRKNHRMLRQGDLARFQQMLQIRGCDRFKLVERVEPALKDSEVAHAKMLSAVSDEIQIKIVARRVVEVDRPDRNFSLARNHLDSRAFEPMLGKNFSR